MNLNISKSFPLCMYMCILCDFYDGCNNKKDFKGSFSTEIEASLTDALNTFWQH